ncbi:hypothetical protein [Dyella terrae]|uniref:hypothetical protein n=1 Tax=Dyella terrae TaxID=522259 RepID=UPI001EFDA0ED|nr:hypothetical protein [Dyella terrae]ULU23948.1 hypothetical protein DYST_00847 [Dyella terrae]
MSTHDHDNDALPGEDELKALYRSLPRKEPSPALDRAIKRAAADAVRPAQRHSVPRWPVAVASVAMLVVAAGLGWRMMLQPSNVPQIPSASSVPASAAPAPAPMPAQPATPPAPPAPDIVTAPEPAAAPAPKMARRAAPSPLSEQDNIRSAMKPKIVVPVAMPAPAPPPAVTEASTMPVEPSPQESIAAAPAPAPPPPAPPSPIAAAPSAMANSAPTAVVGGLSERQAYRATAMKVMAAPAPMPAADATAANPSDTPVQELDKIRQLFALHRRDEALQRLAAFQKTHPDMALPDDLRAQLPDHE